MKIVPKSVGKVLLVGAFLTLCWAFMCPKYRSFRSGYVTTFGSEASHERPASYYKMDLGVFLAGEIVIWAGLWGVFLVAREGPKDEGGDE